MVSNLSDLEKYIDKVVTVKGRFVGWQTANCKFSSNTLDTPITRFDWIIEVGGFCCYVTGGMPEGFSLFNPANTGQIIEVQADAIKTPDGKIYLKYQKSKLLK